MTRAFTFVVALFAAPMACDRAATSSNTPPRSTRPSESNARQPNPSASTDDWPMARHDPQMSGVARGALPEKLDVLWEYDAKEPILGTPAIAGDTVYVGADDGTLYALALADSKPRWTYKTAEGLKSSPSVIDGVVYLGDDDGVLHAVNAADGKARWTYKTEGQIISGVNVAGDRLVFGSYDSYLYCLDRDGKLLWKYKSEDRVHGTPAVVEDVTLASGCDGRLHVVGLADGMKVREVDLAAPCGSSVATSGPLSFVGTYGNQVLCVDWKASRTVWAFEDKEREFPFFASAAIGDGVVYSAGRDKRVRTHDIKTGKPLWQFSANSKIDASPVLVGERLFVGSYDGVLYGLSTKDGEEVWRYDAGSPITAGAAVGRGRMVVGTDDGLVLCFGARGS